MKSEWKKAEDMVPELEKALGDGYNVKVAPLTGTVLVQREGKRIARIFWSLEIGDYKMRLDDRDSEAIARKVSEVMGLSLVV
jgi:hypothetical protein